MSRSALIVLSILPHSSAAWNVFGNGRGWLDECWYEKWRALNCNFGILSVLKSSCVYLFNIHPGPGSINSAPPKPFKNKKPVRRTKCEQLTERSAFGLMWKYQCVLWPVNFILTHLSTLDLAVILYALLTMKGITSCYQNPHVFRLLNNTGLGKLMLDQSLL